MTLDPNEILRGPVLASIDGIDFGLTPQEGFEWGIDVSEVEYNAAQSALTVKRGRNLVGGYVKGILSQMTLERMGIILDTDAPVANLLIATFDGGELTPRILTLQSPGPNGSTRFLTARGTLMAEGTQLGLNDYAGMPWTLKFLGDPVSMELFRIEDIAGTTDPLAISSYDTVNTSTAAETGLTDGATGVAVDQWLQIVFDKPVDPSALRDANFSLGVAGDNTDVALSAISYGVTSGATDRSKVVLKPTADLTAATQYELRVGAGTRAADGFYVAAAARIQFTTA